MRRWAALRSSPRVEVPDGRRGPLLQSLKRSSLLSAHRGERETSQAWLVRRLGAPTEVCPLGIAGNAALKMLLYAFQRTRSLVGVWLGGRIACCATSGSGNRRVHLRWKVAVWVPWVPLFLCTAEGLASELALIAGAWNESQPNAKQKRMVSLPQKLTPDPPVEDPSHRASTPIESPKSWPHSSNQNHSSRHVNFTA